VWPLVHLPSFERVTGPKTDRWLVRTVGALTAVVGAALLVAASRRREDLATQVLAIGSAAALGMVDAHFVARVRSDLRWTRGRRHREPSPARPDGHWWARIARLTSVGAW
jgi:hypothetical protein